MKTHKFTMDNITIKSYMTTDSDSCVIDVIRYDRFGEPGLVKRIRGKKAVDIYRTLVQLEPLEGRL